MTKLNKCFFCDKLTVTPFHVTEINKDQSIEDCNLCKVCGEKYMEELEKKVIDDSPVQSVNLDHITTPEQLLEFLSGLTLAPPEVPKCKCGWTLFDFNRTGRLSCGDCYADLGPKLMSVVVKYHGAERHDGKRPKVGRHKIAEMDLTEKRKLLKLRLAKALELEQYEQAALFKRELDDLSRQSPS